MEGVSSILPVSQVDTAVAAQPVHSRPAPETTAAQVSQLEGPHQVDITV